MSSLLCICLFAGMAFANIQAAEAKSSAEPAIFNVRDYGAVGDGKTIDTRAIQAAVDKCTKAGGGRVVLGKGGTFLSGTVFLKSNVTLYIESGAVLLGSTDIADYPVTNSALRTYTENYTDKSLIYAEKQQNISIMGSGKIDGQGRSKVYNGKPFKLKPYLMRIVECKNVTVKDVTLRHSAMWMQHYLACDDVLVDGITVENSGWVADGIDIDGCHRVRIANSSFESTDDGICLKTTSPRSCEDVTIVNCKVTSVANCFKIGTETSGNFKNISLSNCTFKGSKLAGIMIATVDGGVIEKVRISDVTMQNCKCPIFIRLGNRGRPYLALGKGSAGGGWRLPEGLKMNKMPGVGALRDVIISNIRASDAGIDAGRKLGKDGCCSITGITNHPVENITLENISIQYKGGESELAAQRKVPEVERSYPEQNMFGVLPAYGLFVRHVKGLEIKNFQVGFATNDLRPAIVAVDVAGLKISDFKAQVADGVAPSRFEEVKDLVIRNSPVLEKKR